VTHILMVSVVFFFFFQAEDGIRDLTVTGVQTCALPISGSRRCCRRASPTSSGTTPGRWASSSPPSLRTRCTGSGRRSRKTPRSRSEERRVGKECRSRWGREQEKKKGDKITSNR